MTRIQTNVMVAGITGDVAVFPDTGLKVCRTTISAFKSWYGSSDCVYHQNNLKDVYKWFCCNKPVEDMCMLISNGYIYIFPESRNCIEESLNALLIVEGLFEN